MQANVEGVEGVEGMELNVLQGVGAAEWSLVLRAAGLRAVLKDALRCIWMWRSWS